MRASNNQRIATRLTGSPVILRDEGFVVPVDYRAIRDAAVNGKIPAHQRNGIWHFYREDAAEIAAALRLERAENVTA